MNVLAFTTLFPSVREPTRGLFNQYTLGALGKLCAVRVVVPVPAWKRLGEPAHLFRPPSETRSGILATYPTYWAIPRIAPRWNAASVYRSVRSHVEETRRAFPFDAIVAAFAYPDGVAAARLAADVGCAFIAVVLGSDINELARRPALQGQIRDALLQASTVIAVSGELRSRVAELGVPRDRIVVQQNGVDGARFVVRDRHQARQQLAIPDDRALVCFVGNLVPEKGPDVLLESFGLTRVGGLKDGQLAFIGDGPMRPALTARAAQLGIADRIRFLGKLPPVDVAVWLAAANVVCVPSRREGCPNVVLEGLASGRPIVASAVGGVPEMLSDRNGLMVASEDPAALGGALNRALQTTWDPEHLRASVPSLTWDDFGRTIYDQLSTSLRPRDRRAV